MRECAKMNGKHKFLCYYCKKERNLKRNYKKKEEDLERKTKDLESGVSELGFLDSDNRESLLVTTGMNQVCDSWFIDFGFSYLMCLSKG